jgi:hypothetical protein
VWRDTCDILYYIITSHLLIYVFNRMGSCLSKLTYCYLLSIVLIYFINPSYLLVLSICVCVSELSFLVCFFFCFVLFVSMQLRSLKKQNRPYKIVLLQNMSTPHKLINDTDVIWYSLLINTMVWHSIHTSNHHIYKCICQL